MDSAWKHTKGEVFIRTKFRERHENEYTLSRKVMIENEDWREAVDAQGGPFVVRARNGICRSDPAFPYRSGRDVLEPLAVDPALVAIRNGAGSRRDAVDGRCIPVHNAVPFAFLIKHKDIITVVEFGQLAVLRARPGTNGKEPLSMRVQTGNAVEAAGGEYLLDLGLGYTVVVAMFENRHVELVRPDRKCECCQACGD